MQQTFSKPTDSNVFHTNKNTNNLKIKKKIFDNISCQSLSIEDKTFLHEKHKSHNKNKFHIKLIIKSKELKLLNKIDSNKKIYTILSNEMKEYIHSIQIQIL